MPHTFAGLCSGRLSAYHTQIIVTEAHKLPSPQRQKLFDQRLAGDLKAIETLGPKSLRRRAQSLLDELHPASAAERFAAEAKASCYLDLEELGHGMSRLTAILPTPHAAYIYTVLDATAGPLPAAERDPATGQELLPRGQAMTQALYRKFAPTLGDTASDLDPATQNQARPTIPNKAWPNTPSKSFAPARGHSSTPCHSPAPRSRLSPDQADRPRPQPGQRPTAIPEPTALGVLPITIDLVISDQALLGHGQEPATVLTGGANRNCGPIPASIARALIANSLDHQDPDRPLVWLRKLYVNDAGNLTATSSRQRFHPAGLATMLRLRDQGICRTPWCDAPIRHNDHVLPWSRGGATCLENSAGQCVRCNQSKDAPGWNATAKTNNGQHQITYTEPTGQQTTSHPPNPPHPTT